MLFEIERDGETILLFGGSRPTTTAWSSPAVEALVARCDEFWNEIPAMGPEVRGLVATYGVDPARPLDSWLSADDVNRLNAACAACGVEPSAIAALRPWLAAQVVRTATDGKLGLMHEHSAEAVLTRRAIDAGIPTKSEFATPEDVFAAFGSMPPEAEVQYMRFSLYEIESGTERVVRHAEALARGDMSPIEEETAMMRREWPTFHERLVLDRNRAWLPRIEAMLGARTRAFVLVGTAHLVGDEGLLNLLRIARYSVRQLIDG